MNKKLFLSVSLAVFVLVGAVSVVSLRANAASMPSVSITCNGSDGSCNVQSNKDITIKTEYSNATSCSVYKGTDATGEPIKSLTSKSGNGEYKITIKQIKDPTSYFAICQKINGDVVTTASDAVSVVMRTIPTPTPAPSKTPKPTPTPKPTKTPKPTPTPIPSATSLPVAPKIKVLSPSQGETLLSNRMYQVQWSISRIDSTKSLGIYILKGGQYYYQTGFVALRNQKSAILDFSNGPIEDGKDYSIKVVAIDYYGKTLASASSNNFSFVHYPEMPANLGTLKVVQPNDGKNLQMDKNYSIKWKWMPTDNNNTMLSNVAIELIPEDPNMPGFKRLLANRLDSSGTYNWVPSKTAPYPPPSEIQPVNLNTNYRIRVSGIVLNKTANTDTAEKQRTYYFVSDVSDAPFMVIPQQSALSAVGNFFADIFSPFRSLFVRPPTPTITPSTSDVERKIVPTKTPPAETEKKKSKKVDERNASPSVTPSAEDLRKKQVHQKEASPSPTPTTTPGFDLSAAQKKIKSYEAYLYCQSYSQTASSSYPSQVSSSKCNIGSGDKVAIGWVIGKDMKNCRIKPEGWQTVPVTLYPTQTRSLWIECQDNRDTGKNKSNFYTKSVLVISVPVVRVPTPVYQPAPTTSPVISSTPTPTTSVIPGALPTADIKANLSDGPITVGSNATTGLTWSSSNATSCVASSIPSVDNWTGGSKGISGSQQTGQLTAGPHIYTITCYSADGVYSARDSVVINVVQVSSTLMDSFSFVGNFFADILSAPFQYIAVP